MNNLPATLSRPIEDIDLNRLAFNIATDLLRMDDIARISGVKESDITFLLHNTAFNKMVDEARELWMSADNAKERVRIKAQIAVEDGLPELYAIFGNQNLAPQPRIDAFKHISQLAQVLPEKGMMLGDGNKFSVTINIGNKPSTISGAIYEGDRDD